MKKIFAFPGRFEPFGPHHFKIYKKLSDVNGVENVFIVTSNAQGPTNPLTFLEKKAVMTQYGIPPNQIVCCKAPYKPIELTQRFNPNKDSLIVCCGEKDKGRISTNNGSYYTDYMGQVYTKPFKTQGYLYTFPHQRINYQNQEISGTVLRELLPNLNPNEFKDLVGWYNKEIHELFKKKFAQSQIAEIYDSIHLREGSITKTQLQRVEQYADRLFKEYGIDIEFQNLYTGTHFLQRLNDPRNIDQITADELRNIFKKASQKYGNILAKSNDKAEGVLKDMESDINMPFIIKLDRSNGELDFIPKTIMRKKGFYSNSPVFSMETFKNDFKKILNENTGFDRHIKHPYEDDDLTFASFYEMMLDCCVNNNILASVKLDGVNLQVTLVGGKVRACRNKSTATNPMSVEELIAKYKDKPVLGGTFAKVMQAMEAYIQKELPDFDFDNGRTFLNLEILHPNVQKNYKHDKVPTSAIHNILKYDALGNLTNSSQFTVKPTEINGFKIISTPVVILRPILPTKLKELTNSYRIFIERLKPWKLNANSRISDLPTDQLKHDFKVFCLLVGNAIIQNAFSEHTDLDTENINSIKNRMLEILKKMEQHSHDEKLWQKFKTNRLIYKELGGSVNTREGVVFPYKNGKVYKWTGSFAPINQLLNLFNDK